MDEKPKAFITMSGVGIYKRDPNIVHDENSKQFENDFWSDLVTKWEASIELPKSCDKTRQIAIRSGAILSRHGGMIESMYKQFYFGLGGCLGDGSQLMPFIHIKDLIRLIIFCVETEQMNGVVNAVAPQTCTNLEFSKALAQSMWRPCRLNVPEFVIRNLLAKERASILLDSVNVTPKKALDNKFEFIYTNIIGSMSGLIGLKY